jgi:hypothetical protein
MNFFSGAWIRRAAGSFVQGFDRADAGLKMRLSILLGI